MKPNNGTQFRRYTRADWRLRPATLDLLHQCRALLYAKDQGFDRRMRADRTLYECLKIAREVLRRRTRMTGRKESELPIPGSFRESPARERQKPTDTGEALPAPKRLSAAPRVLVSYPGDMAGYQVAPRWGAEFLDR